MIPGIVAGQMLARRNSLFAPAAGAITITGRAPTLNRSSIIAVPSGSVTVTGLAPTVGRSVVAAVPAGSITVTGYSPTFSIVDDLTSIPMIGRYETRRETVVANLTAQSQATDFSGNGNHAVQATGANQPLYVTGVVNSLPAWRFNGGGQHFLTPSISAMNNTATRWYYVVCRRLTNGNAVNGVFAGRNTGNSNIGDLVYELSANSHANLRYVYSTASMRNVDSSVSLGTGGTFDIIKIVLDGTTALMKFGGAVSFTDSTTQLTPAPNGTFTLMLGDIATPAGNGSNCEIAAVFMGNTALSGTDQTRIETYIQTIYGVTM